MRSGQETIVNKVDKQQNNNRIAKKIFNIAIFIKVSGYFIAVLSLIILIQNEQFLMGILVFLSVAIFVLLSTLFLDAVAEGLQLLQDIKNKI